MKRLVATAMLLGLLLTTGSAFALPMTFEVAGNNDTSLRATVTASYDAATSLANFTLLNTTSTQGTITGFAFNLPGDGAGISSVSYQSGRAGWHLLNENPYTANSINTPMPLGSFDVGLGTGPSFNGGKPNRGIGQGESLAFSLLFSGSGAGSLTMSTILSALSEGAGTDLSQAFAVRFQNTRGEGSDVATPTPLPAAVWLLGSGLAGVLALRRSRAAH